MCPTIRKSKSFSIFFSILRDATRIKPRNECDIFVFHFTTILENIAILYHSISSWSCMCVCCYRVFFSSRCIRFSFGRFIASCARAHSFRSLVGSTGSRRWAMERAYIAWYTFRCLCNGTSTWLDAWMQCNNAHLLVNYLSFPLHVSSSSSHHPTHSCTFIYFSKRIPCYLQLRCDGALIIATAHYAPYLVRLCASFSFTVCVYVQYNWRKDKFAKIKLN